MNQKKQQHALSAISARRPHTPCRGKSWVAYLALGLAVASCATPSAGVNPQGGPAVPATVLPGAVASPAVSGAAAVATPAPAPALPPAPPVAKDARSRLTGTVLFNDTPVSDASLVATDLATGKALTLMPWSDTPKAFRLSSTQLTDAQGAFDLELPQLTEGQMVKLVATKGTQTFTAIFNDRGQTGVAAKPPASAYGPSQTPAHQAPSSRRADTSLWRLMKTAFTT